MNATPHINPMTGAIHTICPCVLTISIAGNSNEKKLADSINPAAKPSEISNIFLCGDLIKKTDAAPKDVPSHTNSPPKQTSIKGDNPSKYSTIFKLLFLLFYDLFYDKI